MCELYPNFFRANFFQNFSDKRGLVSDISLVSKDRFNAKDYARFLNNCKFQIGTEAGTDYFELTDNVRNEVNSFLQSKKADWSEIYELFFKSRIQKLPMRIISGKNIEAAACGTIQILFENRVRSQTTPRNKGGGACS